MPRLRVSQSMAHSTAVTPGAVGPNNKNMSVKNEYVKPRVSCARAPRLPLHRLLSYYFFTIVFSFPRGRIIVYNARPHSTRVY